MLEGILIATLVAAIAVGDEIVNGQLEISRRLLDWLNKTERQRPKSSKD
ncbi:MAG: hypothetical protein ACFB4I_21300 [Cyanophyceae cyanobacterium]